MKRLKKNADINERLGQCYVLSYQYATSNPNSELIHGNITNKFDGKTIDHAWVEENGEVYDPVLDWRIMKEVYYGLYDAQVEKRYTFQEALNEGIESGTYGPWHE
ncbi:hypothetical protein D3C81_610110 [compost metagenome]